MKVITSKDITTEQKYVVFKAYKHLIQIEKAMKLHKGFNTSKIQVSILGKVTESNSNDPK
jgi:hypothetical protein